MFDIRLTMKKMILCAICTAAFLSLGASSSFAKAAKAKNPDAVIVTGRPIWDFGDNPFIPPEKLLQAASQVEIEKVIQGMQITMASLCEKQSDSRAMAKLQTDIRLLSMDACRLNWFREELDRKVRKLTGDDNSIQMIQEIKNSNNIEKVLHLESMAWQRVHFTETNVEEAVTEIFYLRMGLEKSIRATSKIFMIWSMGSSILMRLYKMPLLLAGMSQTSPFMQLYVKYNTLDCSSETT